MIRIREKSELAIFGKTPGNFKIVFRIEDRVMYPDLVSYNREETSNYKEIENPNTPQGFIVKKLFTERVGGVEWVFEPEEYMKYINFLRTYFFVSGKTTLMSSKDYLIVEGDLSKVSQRDLDAIEGVRI